jgi:hypothetical protein
MVNVEGNGNECVLAFVVREANLRGISHNRIEL